MKDMDINVLLRKAEELKALFTLGQRVIPFLEEIFLFVKEIKPLIDEINTNIEENLKKMPNASKQLSKVTEATELATTEIMDIVDGLVYKADLISGNLKLMSDIEKNRRQSPIKALEILQHAADNDEDITSYTNSLSKIINNLRGSHGKEYQKAFIENESLLESIKDDSNNIMYSLQVQDITSQQIAAVNHLLETIQDKLSGIMGKFRISGINEILEEEKSYERTNVTTLHRRIAFDPEAVDSIAGKETRQGEIDLMIDNISEAAADIDGLQVASDDDIDALFAGNGANDEEIEKDNPNLNQSDDETIFEPSVSDINPNDLKENDEVAIDEDDFTHFSQEDIDAIFSGEK